MTLTASRFYVLQVIGDVEPLLHGPFETEEERDALARKVHDKSDDGGLYDGVYAVEIKNGEMSVDSYSGAFFESKS